MSKRKGVTGRRHSERGRSGREHMRGSELSKSGDGGTSAKRTKRKFKRANLKRAMSAGSSKSAELASFRACLVVSTPLGVFLTTHLHHSKKINEVQLGQLDLLLKKLAKSVVQGSSVTDPGQLPEVNDGRLFLTGDLNNRCDKFAGGLVNWVPREAATFIEEINNTQSIDVVASITRPKRVHMDKVEHPSQYKDVSERERVKIISSLKRFKRQFVQTGGALCDHAGRPNGSCVRCQLRVPFSVLRELRVSWFGHPSTLVGNSDHGSQFVEFSDFSLFNLNVLDSSAYLLTAFARSQHSWILSPRRFHSISDRILSLNPDVITLQEVGSDPLRVFKSRFRARYKIFYAPHSPQNFSSTRLSSRGHRQRNPCGRSDGVMICIRHPIKASSVKYYFSSKPENEKL